jgi:hypothetical protein
MLLSYFPPRIVDGIDRIWKVNFAVQKRWFDGALAFRDWTASVQYKKGFLSVTDIWK